MTARLRLVPPAPSAPEEPAVAPRAFAHDPSQRGYHVAYRAGQPNYCPGCGRSHWYVGRTSAECAFCQTALPIERKMPRD